MPNIQDYLAEQKNARNSVETLKRRLRQAYDKAQAATRAIDGEGNPTGNYDRLDRLVDEEVRARFKETITAELSNPLQGAIAALPEDPLYAETLAWQGFYGFTREQITGLVDNVKDGMSFDTYMKYLSEQTDVGRAVQTRKQTPLNLLDQIRTEEVLDYVGLTCDLDARDNVTLDVKKELLDLFEGAGAIPPKYLESKPYLRKNGNRVIAP